MSVTSQGAGLPVVVIVVIFGSLCAADNSSVPEYPSQVEFGREFLQRVAAPFRKSVTRAVVEAEVSTECQVFLLKFAAGVEKIEPWTSRLLDATGKGPIGLFQGTLADLGAFDSCIETVLTSEEGEETLRGQYCNVYIKSPHGDYVRHIGNITTLSHRRTPEFINFQNSGEVPGIRIGICVSTDCSREDLQKLATKIGKNLVSDITIGSCITSLPKPIETRQLLVLILLAVLVSLVVLGTLTDYLSETRYKSDSSNASMLRRVLHCFSFTSNGTLLMHVNDDVRSDAYAYKFIHGMKFWSMYGVVFGHAYTVFDFTVVSRLVNALHYGDSLWFCLVISGYLCVDTFLFIGALLATYNILAAKESPTRVSIVAIVKRFIRGTIPALFVMVLLFLVPLVLDGPGVQDYYETYRKQFDLDWLAVLLQYRNWQTHVDMQDIGAPSMGPLWYLSVDFQLFVVVVVCLALTNRESRAFHTIMGCVSVASIIFTGVYIYGEIYMPFVLPMAEDWEVIKRTLFSFYHFTTTHAPCYCLGASTMILIRDYKEVKLSKRRQTLFWIGSSICAIYAVFGTYPWNSGNYPSEFWKSFFAMTQRPLWAVFLSWFTFACATGQGGLFAKFLSWNGFVPLSRLSFGVYLIHLPIYFVEAAVARERIFFSYLNMMNRCFSVLVWGFIFASAIFMLVEAPIGRLEKMILSREVRPGSSQADVETANNKKNLKALQFPHRKPQAYLNNGFYTASQQDLSPIKHHSIKL